MTPLAPHDTSVCRFMARQHGLDPELLDDDQVEELLLEFEDSEEFQMEFRAGMV